MEKDELFLMQMNRENNDSGVKHTDWHAQRHNGEPRCGKDQWRTRDRSVIAYMHEMHDRHLEHCIRFASTRPQHASRLDSLLHEQAMRTMARNDI